ncbi:alpha/beta-hydrolase [Fistulina hepatica ATCC 64428]|uniref:Alpha/beta-hydrolase n=1 Tax=Fistulina hepatica ATCC 64428 TaxID=1128425 RepID=A0A0D6ZYU9_9AGAR|nr:alpha/beta-hydrolase [Fistulina hepatica ATCC 64428]
MPSVKIKASGGTLNVNYTISTPGLSSATTIDPKLPTIVFLHPVYIAQDIFHLQFADSQLRRYNMIAYDLRCQGETTSKHPTQQWSRADAADELAKFMEALKLPACHLVGVSMGSCIALQTSITYPQKVLSVIMLSPLPLEEPPEVCEGREEIYAVWAEGYADPKHADYEELQDAVWGASQLMFNSQESPLVNALIKRTLPQALRNWTPDRFCDLHAVSVGFFVSRHPHPKATLAAIHCPITLIHCSGDIAYPIEYARELYDTMQDAGVDAHLESVPGPHFANVTNSREVNPILAKAVARATTEPLPPIPTEVVSPFESTLAKLGLYDDDDDSSDDYSI